RCEQDSNLRGDTPLDFKSNALTTRPSQLLHSPWHKMTGNKFGDFGYCPLNTGFTVVGIKHTETSSKRKLRCEQDSNLRGEIPLDFESNALTTRPSQRRVKLQCIVSCYSVRKKVPKKYSRCEQDLILRGETALDFKSNALTTR
ncbi:unnamed protein product, partial [Porites evermanni]